MGDAQQLRVLLSSIPSPRPKIPPPSLQRKGEQLLLPVPFEPIEHVFWLRRAEAVPGLVGLSAHVHDQPARGVPETVEDGIDRLGRELLPLVDDQPHVIDPVPPSRAMLAEKLDGLLLLRRTYWSIGHDLT